MTITLDVVARIYCFEQEQLLKFVGDEFLKYGIDPNPPFMMDSVNTHKLMTGYRFSMTRTCGICRGDTPLSEKNPNLFDGFRDAGFGLFVCNKCRTHENYISLKSGINH